MESRAFRDMCAVHAMEAIIRTKVYVSQQGVQDMADKAWSIADAMSERRDERDEIIETHLQRVVDGKCVEVGSDGPSSSGLVVAKRTFEAFHSHQIDPNDPAIDAAGIQRTAEGDPIFRSRREVAEFEAASRDSGGSAWVHDGMDSKSRRPEWKKPRQIFTGKGGRPVS